jgi:Protein kinase domain
MGTVYEGVQAEAGAAVAIKVLAERYAHDANLIDRFFAEARATNVIAHENIVKVHDLARLADGRPYIVMELLAGKTLRELVDGAPLPIGGVVNLVLEVLSALGATHAAGIVHRDIKPDNIFVTEKGRTKVLDFGIAKLTGANAVARTETGVLLGTPEYMAPEQITEGTVDVRTDLYALGVVLFEALTGKRPFDAKSDFELMRAHVSTRAPAPSSLRADLPPAFDDIVRIALAKDPRDRFATTNAMATALHHVASELTLDEWRPLVPGGRLPSPKPPTNFDWRGYIPTAQALARTRAADATWIMLALDGVMPDGRVELAKRGMGGLFYSFRTKQPGKCEIRILITPTGPLIAEIDGSGTICDQQPIPTPRCDLAHVRRAAKLDTDAPTTVIWFDKGWFVSNQARPHMIPDDCGLPKRDPLDPEPGLAAARTRATDIDEDAVLAGITTVVMDDDLIEFTYAFRSSTHCILVARDANIARDEECPRYPTQLPRCTIARQRARAKVKPDVKRVKYEYARDGWDITIRQADGARTKVHLADDC